MSSARSSHRSRQSSHAAASELPPGSFAGSARSYSKTSPMASPGRTRTAAVTPLRAGGRPSSNNASTADDQPDTAVADPAASFINLQDVLAASPMRRANPIEAVKAAGDEGPILVKVDKTSARRRRLVRQKKLRNKICAGWILFLSLLAVPTIINYWAETSNTVLLGRIQDLESNLGAEAVLRAANDTVLITDLTSLDTQVTGKLQATELITTENARRVLELEVLSRSHTGRIIVLEAESDDYERRVSTLEAAANTTTADVTQLNSDSAEFRGRIAVLESQASDLTGNSSFLLQRNVNITTRTEDLEELGASNADRAGSLEYRATVLETTASSLTNTTDDHETRVLGLEANMTDVRARAVVLEAEMDTAQGDIVSLETFQSQATATIGALRRANMMYTQYRFLSTHFGRVAKVAGMALPDGYIVSGGADDLRVKVWDTTTATEIASQVSPGSVSAIATSPSNHLFTGTFNGTIVRWTWDPLAQTLERQFAYPAHGTVRVTRLLVLSNQDLLSCGADRFLRIWTTGAVVTQVAQLVGHTLGVTDMAVVDETDTIVSGDSGGNLIIWKAKASAGHVVLPSPPVSTSVVAVVALSRERVAAAFGDEHIRVYNIFTELQEATYDTSGTFGFLTAINVLPDESIITGHSNGKLAVWDPEVGDKVLERQTSSTTEITSVIALYDGTIVSSDATDIIVWRNGFSAPSVRV